MATKYQIKDHRNLPGTLLLNPLALAYSMTISKRRAIVARTYRTANSSCMRAGNVRLSRTVIRSSHGRPTGAWD